MLGIARRDKRPFSDLSFSGGVPSARNAKRGRRSRRPLPVPLFDTSQGVAGTFGFPAISDSGSGQHVASLYVSPDVVPR